MFYDRWVSCEVGTVMHLVTGIRILEFVLRPELGGIIRSAVYFIVLDKVFLCKLNILDFNCALTFLCSAWRTRRLDFVTVDIFEEIFLF